MSALDCVPQPLTTRCEWTATIRPKHPALFHGRVFLLHAYGDGSRVGSLIYWKRITMGSRVLLQSYTVGWCSTDEGPFGWCEMSPKATGSTRSRWLGTSAPACRWHRGKAIYLWARTRASRS